MTVGVSIVLYRNGDEIEKTINCILNSKLDIKLFLIDNSETNRLEKFAKGNRTEYIFNNENIGYGSAHNIGIKKSTADGAKYHVVINPDITFEKGTLESIFEYMEEHLDVGSLMPRVFYEDGSIQRLCKLLPTPFDLIGRRFMGNTNWAKKQNSKYELHDFDYSSILNTPCLSGCFMFVRASAFEKSGLFDHRYFMYLEDYDLIRRINRYSKTIFYPYVSIIHGHAKESYKNGKLLKIHIQSAIKYFNKWGWFFDEERKRINQEVLSVIKNNITNW
nr:glycosyltransferase family 2 protein [Pedobacter panaciterrae]